MCNADLTEAGLSGATLEGVDRLEANLTKTQARLGVAAIETRGRGGRRNDYLRWEEEVEFLAPFIADSAKGVLTTIQTIHQVFEQRVSTSVHPSTIYRLLERHGWRKLTPRPYHPQGDRQAQEAFKKTFPHWFKPL